MVAAGNIHWLAFGCFGARSTDLLCGGPNFAGTIHSRRSYGGWWAGFVAVGWQSMGIMVVAGPGLGL